MAFAASAPRIFDDKAMARVVWALCAVYPIRATVEDGSFFVGFAEAHGLRAFGRQASKECSVT